MGLDNGIYVKLKNEEEARTFIDEIPVNIGSAGIYHHCFDGEDYWRVDLCYWRKYWNFRDEVVRKLHIDNEGGYYKIDIDDIEVISAIIRDHLKPSYYTEENFDEYWEEEIYQDNMLENYVVTLWLFNQMMYEDLDVYFYDSY